MQLSSVLRRTARLALRLVSLTWIASFALAPPALAQQDLDDLLKPVAKPSYEMTVGPFGPADLRKTESQREQVATLARRHLGLAIGRSTSTDLEALQRLIDEGHVRSGDVYLQQSLGVVLGDALDRDLRILQWAVVDDEYGHSRALQYRTTDQVFFPITMIPKRVKARERIDVHALYDQVKDAAERLELDRDAHLRRARGRR